MSNRNKINGNEAEAALVKWLRANGFPDACRARGEAQDWGDVGGVPGTAVQVKRAAKRGYLLARLRDGQRGVLEQAQGRRAVVVVRPPRVTDPARWWAATPVPDAIFGAVAPPDDLGAELARDVGVNVAARCGADVIDEAIADWRGCVRDGWVITDASTLFGALARVRAS